MNENRSQENQERRPLNIRVCCEESDTKNEEILEEVDVCDCLDEQGCLYLSKLVLLLKKDYNLSLQNKEIYYFMQRGQIWVNCGIDPVGEDLCLRPEDWDSEQLLLKAKQLGVSLVHRLMSFENLNTGEQKDRTCADEMAQRSKCRRTKQRRIGHIIDKVIEWRKYYSGAINQKNQQVKYSLQDAAREVKISKKSLDDYLFQIRFGQRYGFNFNEHYNDKVGVLRDFVRQRKKVDKTEIKARKIKNNDREEQ